MIWAVTTGKMAVKILTGEADISEMPIEYAPQFTKKYNPDLASCPGRHHSRGLRGHRLILPTNKPREEGSLSPRFSD